MRLSEAIMLGAATVRMRPGNINNCALGAALNAMGVPPIATRPHPRPVDFARVEAAERLWPWLAGTYGPVSSDLAQEIIRKFDGPVCNGEMTLESLVDFVRSVEPNCDCNRFNCDCGQSSINVEVEEHSHV